jgi:hypothetical protein
MLHCAFDACLEVQCKVNIIIITITASQRNPLCTWRKLESESMILCGFYYQMTLTLCAGNTAPGGGEQEQDGRLLLPV